LKFSRGSAIFEGREPEGGGNPKEGNLNMILWKPAERKGGGEGSKGRTEDFIRSRRKVKRDLKKLYFIRTSIRAKKKESWTKNRRKRGRMPKELGKGGEEEKSGKSRLPVPSGEGKKTIEEKTPPGRSEDGENQGRSLNPNILIVKGGSKIGYSEKEIEKKHKRVRKRGRRISEGSKGPSYESQRRRRAMEVRSEGGGLMGEGLGERWREKKILLENLLSFSHQSAKGGGGRSNECRW